MYSNNIEDLITHISSVRDTLALKIIDLVNDSKYRIYNEPHVHELYNPVLVGDGWGLAYGTCLPMASFESDVGEGYTPLNTLDYVQPIIDAYSDIIVDKSDLSVVEIQMFDDKVNITNSYGSPWGEFDNLDYIINEIIEYSIKHPILRFSNEKRGLIDLMQLAVPCCNDCKWAIIHYYDIISRGYDDVHNGKKESIQWENNTIEDKNNIKGANFYKDDPSSKDPY